ncbi:hypothetical protein QNI16_02405 [Cytophagaceae bacterium YF14B1]|uniref:Uncharacterized protein n=1 Tax=Xanthocytophaga flava TaxID=3048013 RepID=A0AAE3QME8_9BACT|nr:hypothetical protein [Xanthocytophaga flavus]MDJ1479318.1 hypothetical protein [Xanthocytophaga flavus]
MNRIRVNAMEIEQLLDLMERNNFLYPAKKEKLIPVLGSIKQNLQRAFGLPDSMYRTLTFYDGAEQMFASIAAWKYTPSSMIILHLVSNQPVKTREIFFYHILKLAAIEQEPVQAILTYYQPKTRFAHRMFTHLYERRVDEGVLIEPFHFYAFQRNSIDNTQGQNSPFTYNIIKELDSQLVYVNGSAIPGYESSSADAKKIIKPLVEKWLNKGIQDKDTNATSPVGTKSTGRWQIRSIRQEDHAAFADLLQAERSQLYTQALDLEGQDMTLTKLDGRYQQQGLTRRRAILLCYAKDSGLLAGALIINRGSVGLHFSQIENAAEFIGNSLLSPTELSEALSTLIQSSKEAYADCELDVVPLLIKSSQAEQMSVPGLVFQRQYNLMICNRANFINWITYLMQEYEKSLNYSVNQSDTMSVEAA